MNFYWMKTDIDFSGKYLLRPDDIPIDVFITELSFYNLGRDTIEDFLKSEGMLRTPVQSKVDTIDRYPAMVPDVTEFRLESTFWHLVTVTHDCNLRRTLSFVWELCEDPRSSIFARVYSILSVILIFISIGIFCAGKPFQVCMYITTVAFRNCATCKMLGRLWQKSSKTSQYKQRRLHWVQYRLPRHATLANIHAVYRSKFLCLLHHGKFLTQNFWIIKIISGYVPWVVYGWTDCSFFCMSVKEKLLSAAAQCNRHYRSCPVTGLDGGWYGWTGSFEDFESAENFKNGSILKRTSRFGPNNYYVEKSYFVTVRLSCYNGDYVWCMLHIPWGWWKSLSAERLHNHWRTLVGSHNNDHCRLWRRSTDCKFLVFIKLDFYVSSKLLTRKTS